MTTLAFVLIACLGLLAVVAVRAEPVRQPIPVRCRRG